jgi:hypothetical protein
MCSAVAATFSIFHFRRLNSVCGTGGRAMNEFELKLIVDGLNQPPFNQRLTLVRFAMRLSSAASRFGFLQVSFANKNSIELLQCVNDVFACLDSKQQKDIRDEASDATAVRMLEFIHVLNYKIDELYARTLF